MKAMKWLLLATLAAGCGMNKSGIARPGALSAVDYFCWEPGTLFTYSGEMLGHPEDHEVTIVRRRADGSIEDSTGARFIADRIGVRDNRRYILQNPLVAGHHWENIVSMSAVERYRIVSVGNECATPAGRWQNCVVVESRTKIDGKVDLVNRYTLAPGTGIVQLATSIDRGATIEPQTSFQLSRRKAPGA